MKTATTVNFLLRSALEGHAVTYIPSETGDLSIIKRLIAVHGSLPVNCMRNPFKHLDREQLIKYKSTMNEISQLPIHIEELHDIGEIRQLARERRKEFPDKKHLFIIDHLGHLSSSKVYQSRTLEFEDYCLQLKAVAKEYNIALMLLSQLSRGVEQRPDKRPMMSDLRDSGAIEQIADVCIFLYRENYYLDPDKKHDRDEIELIIAKNRDGGVGRVKLEFIPETNQVMDLIQENEE